jgi:hypothetical protein
MGRACLGRLRLPTSVAAHSVVLWVVAHMRVHPHATMASVLSHVKALRFLLDCDVTMSQCAPCRPGGHAEAAATGPHDTDALPLEIHPHLRKERGGPMLMMRPAPRPLCSTRASQQYVDTHAACTLRTLEAAFQEQRMRWPWRGQGRTATPVLQAQCRTNAYVGADEGGCVLRGVWVEHAGDVRQREGSHDGLGHPRQPGVGRCVAARLI